MAEFNKKVVLSDGSEFYGYGFGGCCNAVCELVFSTSMVGYQEIFSDPANANKIVVMTYPLIGNCGVADDDLESKSPTLGGLIVREYNNWPSNFRYTETLSEILEESCIPAITGVDTRQLTRHIRESGTQYALITDADTPLEEALKAITHAAVPANPVASASCKKRWYSRTSNHKLNIAVVDCGLKLGTVKNLNQRSCNVTVFPYDVSLELVESVSPDGVFISSGPGSPDDIGCVVELVQKLKGKYPVFGLGLGCLAVALACGAQCEKMKTGHHGDNLPVRNILTGRISTVNQNHNYTINEASLSGTVLTVTHKNVIDGSVEGVYSPADKLFGLEFYYDITDEENDTTYLFDRFLEAAREVNKNA